ncbi:VOC family protein [Thioclava atlantica]|uniref:PhnB protein n=1 Tax=Thioclava atlantica TaxID=1317124 RepID=A0A085U0Z8_9RHOB|nr:VOC family protein [Thioclava atlantica]KFE36645.1 PhnB protein [Thioclava atlantica]
MSFDPYIHFQGNCAAAMEFYADLFGGELSMMRYGEMPVEERQGPLSEAGAKRIMHASLVIGNRSLMASDWPEGAEGGPQASVSISHAEPTRAKARAIYDALSEDAREVMMPFGDTFFADGFGMLRDRFGTAWMIMGPVKM